jgi:hypothetical protein
MSLPAEVRILNRRSGKVRRFDGGEFACLIA